MKRYAIYCRDKADTAEARLVHRDAHFAHVEKHMDRYHVAGPIKDTQGNVTGSLIIVEAQDADAARAFLESDPYYAADIWQTIEIHEFVAAAGGWIGGKKW